MVLAVVVAGEAEVDGCGCVSQVEPTDLAYDLRIANRRRNQGELVGFWFAYPL